MDPRERVMLPAIGLIVVGVIGLPMQLLSIALNLLGIGLGGVVGGNDGMVNILSGAFGLVLNVIQLGMAVAVLYGGFKMKNLENYGFAVASAILAIVPCTSPCCCLGIPVGIWALVVLFDPNVKSAFLGQGPAAPMGQVPPTQQG